jgi:hypothetical protein
MARIRVAFKTQQRIGEGIETPAHKRRARLETDC